MMIETFVPCDAVSFFSTKLSLCATSRSCFRCLFYWQSAGELIQRRIKYWM